MALSREEVIALGAGAVAAVGVIALARRAPLGGAGELAVAVTGPSERTASELIRASTESQRISATLERDLADIYGSTLVDLTAIESREDIALATVASQERIRGQELGAEVQIAGIFGETQRYIANTRVQAIQAQNAPQEQRNLFDFILDIGKVILPFLF